ncbi:hypothetical protein T4B_12458 [Trichinella pseudospiralis]|uniref:Uncharacterized protein n=1 Tax=Trichinella pseudospiralis TaxID=6337 RepID=A0A0V1H305_TRIPS|nr:hypothetical protein T4B_12458 [Trichinella pseudospiralis]
MQIDKSCHSFSFHDANSTINVLRQIYSIKQQMLLKLSKVLFIFYLINLSYSQTSTCQTNNGGAAADCLFYED